MTGELMDVEAVEPQAEPIDNIIEEAMPEQDDGDSGNETEQSSSKMIPLSVAQKLREKKKELEMELQFERQERQRMIAQQNAIQKPVEEDNSRYETATKEDVKLSQEEVFRAVEEKLWIKQNPEKYERVNEDLAKFLKQRPNLASAIHQATNRYEEAYELMAALTPKQQRDMRAAPTVQKKEAPNAPGGIPKAAALNEAVDVMAMNDTEFRNWMQSKRKQR